MWKLDEIIYDLLAELPDKFFFEIEADDLHKVTEKWAEAEAELEGVTYLYQVWYSCPKKYPILRKKYLKFMEKKYSLSRKEKKNEIKN